jgi:hypothetical protein
LTNLKSSGRGSINKTFEMFENLETGTLRICSAQARYRLLRVSGYYGILNILPKIVEEHLD